MMMGDAVGGRPTLRTTTRRRQQDDTTLLLAVKSSGGERGGERGLDRNAQSTTSNASTDDDARGGHKGGTPLTRHRRTSETDDDDDDDFDDDFDEREKKKEEMKIKVADAADGTPRGKKREGKEDDETKAARGKKTTTTTEKMMMMMNGDDDDDDDDDADNNRGSGDEAEYIKYDSLFDARKIFSQSGCSNRQKSIAVSHYINDSLDRLVYGYKHKTNVPAHVSFGQPIERIAVGCGLEEDDWEELEGVGLKERTRVRKEMEKRFITEEEDLDEVGAEEEDLQNQQQMLRRNADDALDYGGGAIEEDGEEEDDSDEFDEDDHDEDGVHRFEFHNNTFYNNAALPLPSFGKDLNHAMYPNPTTRKRRQQEINYNKQKMNKTSGMIDAHQFDIGVESDGNNVSVDWTDDLSLWAALDHLDTNNNNNNEAITPQQQQHHQRRLSNLGVGASPPNKNKNYAQQANNAHDIATVVSNLPATAQANAVGALASGTTIVHHHHHYPPNSSNNNISLDKEQQSGGSSIEALLNRLEQLEKKLVSHSSKSNGREEDNAEDTTRKMLFTTNEKGANNNEDHVVNANNKDENNNESDKNSGGDQMSLLERRVSDLERLLRASELENSTLKRALHFKSQPANKDSDEKEGNNNKTSAKKKIDTTLSHSNAAEGDAKKTNSEDVNNNCCDDSHGPSNGKSDKTNEETLQTLSEKDKDDKLERNDDLTGGVTTEAKRHPSENMRENGAIGDGVHGVSPDSIFYAETNKQQQQQQQQQTKSTTAANLNPIREVEEENQVGTVRRSLDRELM